MRAIRGKGPGFVVAAVAAVPSLLFACSRTPATESSGRPVAFEQVPGSVPHRPFPPERDRLRVEGRRFYDSDNHAWRWRGATEFLLFARFLAGEDITPQLDWLVDRGFNIVRVFGEVNWSDDFARVLHYERPFERPDFDAKLRAFFERLASRGLRCEYTVLTYADSLAVMRAYVQRAFDVAAPHWNVMVEVANEPENNGIDPVAALEGVDRHGVLSAYGLDPARADVNRWRSVRVLDYGTTHDLQRDFEHSPRNTKDAMDMQGAFGVAFVNDEPIGAIDPGHAGFAKTGPETWGRIGGGGARTVSRDLFISAAAIAYMYSAGYTFHFQAGLEGRIPTPNEAVQDGVAAALRDVAKFLPNETQLGVYVEAHLGDFGLAWKNGPHAESLVDRGYGVVLGNKQWVVVPMPAPRWSPTPINGWRLDAVGPVPYVLRLAR